MTWRWAAGAVAWFVLGVGFGTGCGDGGSGSGDGGPETGGPGSSGPGSESSGPGDETSAGPTTATEDSGTSAASADTTDTTGTPEPIEVTLGESCELGERVGAINLMLAGGTASIDGLVYDAVDPWIGEAELSNATCAFHRFDPSICGTCDPGDVCSTTGECVAQRLARTDATLTITGDGVDMTVDADPITGALFGSFPAGEQPITLGLEVAGLAIAVPPMVFGEVPGDLAVTGGGDSCAPTGLDVSWTPADDGSRVETVIPINHHAGGPTFTRCAASVADGPLHADEAMLTPLAVITCLEFQGVDVVQVAAANTPLGCIDIRLGQRASAGRVVWQ